MLLLASPNATFRRAHTRCLRVLLRRFAVKAIAVGDELLSWGLPFGVATAPISPGQYCSNASIIESLATRHVDFELPTQGNFVDCIRKYELKDDAACVSEQVVLRHVPLQWPLRSSCTRFVCCCGAGASPAC